MDAVVIVCIYGEGASTVEGEAVRTEYSRIGLSRILVREGV